MNKSVKVTPLRSVPHHKGSADNMNAVKHSGTFWFWQGATVAILATFPMAALLALSYRFPIPFKGYESGIRAVLPSIFAVVFYGVGTAGFLITGLLGGAGGLFVSLIRQDAYQNSRKYFCALISVFVAFLSTGTLAVLDKLIGPW